MKRNIIGISLISIIILIVGIIYINIFPKRNNTENQKDTNAASSYNLKGKKIIIDSTPSALIEKAYSDDFATIVNHSDAVVKGYVKSLEYIPVKGRAWTKVKLHIDKVITGSVKSNNDIDVYFLGGYITLEDHIKEHDDAYRYEKMSDEEIKNTVIKETYEGEDEFVKENEKLVLCIGRTSDHSPLPKGAYERLGAPGMLKEKDGKYVQLYGEVRDKYSVDKDKLNDIKKLIK